MKSHITVILDLQSENIYASLEKALEPHRLDWDNDTSIENHHWDYWYFPDNKGFNDTELKNSYKKEDSEILTNACFIKNLPPNFTTSGIITLAGNWIDLQDFGWRMVDEPSTANTEALKQWSLKCNEILATNQNAICVQVLLHS